MTASQYLTLDEQIAYEDTLIDSFSGDEFGQFIDHMDELDYMDGYDYLPDCLYDGVSSQETPDYTDDLYDNGDHSME